MSKTSITKNGDAKHMKNRVTQTTRAGNDSSGKRDRKSFDAEIGKDTLARFSLHKIGDDLVLRGVGPDGGRYEKWSVGALASWPKAQRTPANDLPTQGASPEPISEFASEMLLKMMLSIVRTPVEDGSDKAGVSGSVAAGQWINDMRETFREKRRLDERSVKAVT